MASTWPQSRVPWIDENGDPYVGAKLNFYNANTLTPQVVYSDAALATPIDQPIETNSRGQWPMIYLSATPGQYRQIATDSTGAVTLFDDDEIDVYQSALYVPPDAGATDITLLARIGDVKARHGTGTHSGWVRGAGRTIGSASSGATERANADTSDLFQFLWTADSSLAVSGGRGGTAAGDFSANKTIALPDYRERVLAGLADMGNSASSLLTGNTIDSSETNITLGATLGVGTHILTTAQMPSHTHTFNGSALPTHQHTSAVGGTDGSSGIAADGGAPITANPLGSAVSAGTPSGTNSSTGTDAAHPNVQPTALVTFYVKL